MVTILYRVGDLYCAAKDYLYVIQNWPNEIKAYINLIKCLLALEWEQDATRWYSYLCDIEPNFDDQKEAKNIRRSIQELQHKPLDSPPANTDRSLIQGDETKRRHESIDYKLRFVGHCNTTTDIMEANFLGEYFGTTRSYKFSNQHSLKSLKLQYNLVINQQSPV